MTDSTNREILKLSIIRDLEMFSRSENMDGATKDDDRKI